MTKLHTTIVFIPLTIRDTGKREWFNVHQIICYKDYALRALGEFSDYHVNESEKEITALLKGILTKEK